MRQTPFFKFGKCVYTHRIAILVIWCFLILGCLPFLPDIMTPFKSTGFIDNQSDSTKTDKDIDKQLGYNHNRFVILFHSKTLKTSNPLYLQKIKKSLVQLDTISTEHEILYPDINKQQVSKDKHSAYAVVIFKTKKTPGHQLLTQIKDNIKTPHNMTMLIGEESVFLDSVNKQTQKDLYNADIIAAPVSLIILIVVFGSIVAATIPVVLGGGCAILILTALFTIGHAISLSIFTINIALLLGICLSLDYSLFIVSRFREELTNQATLSDAIATTLETAGKAVFFSGLAVLISLSALLLFPINILYSVGVGGITAVFFAVLIAIVVLPALLSVLKTHVNRLPVRLFKKKNPHYVSIWRRLATTVVKNPLLFFIAALLILLLLGTPFLKSKLGISDVHILPKHTESRQFFNGYEAAFNVQELTPIQLAITTNKGRILSDKNINRLYTFAHKLKHLTHVKKVYGIATPEPALDKTQLHLLYKSPITNLKVRQLLKTTTSKRMTLITVVSTHDANARETKTLINELRQMNPGRGLTLHLTGVPVRNMEVLERIAQIFPYAIAWIIALTYLVLLILLRSLFLPLKAILMNGLSLCATYGVLVFVFQEGHFSTLFNFEAQGILDVSLLVIIFCALFGFSMDYEVFLLTRIQEHYLKTKQNGESIVFGIEHSSRIITSAAIIVIVTCGSFMVAEVLLVKEFGLGIAVAIIVDAFIVRTIFVPATMTLIKSWNWYLPKWLDRILPKS